MSYKLTCPGCDRYLSSIFRAYEDGRPCPHCGSGLQAASEQYYRQLPDDHHLTDERKCEHGYGIKQGPCPTCDSASDIRLRCRRCRKYQTGIEPAWPSESLCNDCYRRLT